MAETRVEPVTVSSAEENKRLATIAPQPAAGGWAPGVWVPLVVAVLVGALSAVGASLAAGPVTVASIIGAALAGAGTGLAAFFGIKSAGPRTP